MCLQKDQSLARAIGRSYSKALCAEWEKYRSRKRQSIARNSSPYRKVKNNRQLRERQLLLDKLLGNPTDMRIIDLPPKASISGWRVDQYKNRWDIIEKLLN